MFIAKQKSPFQIVCHGRSCCVFIGSRQGGLWALSLSLFVFLNLHCHASLTHCIYCVAAGSVLCCRTADSLSPALHLRCVVTVCTVHQMPNKGLATWRQWPLVALRQVFLGRACPSSDPNPTQNQNVSLNLNPCLCVFPACAIGLPPYPPSPIA